MKDVVVIHSRSRSATYVVLLGGAVLLATATALAADDALVVVVTGLVACALALALVLLARQRTVASTEGLDIYTFTRVRRFSWDEIEGFEVRTASDDPTFESPYVTLRDGRTIPLAGTHRAFELIRTGQRAKALDIVRLLSSYAADHSTGRR